MAFPVLVELFYDAVWNDISTPGYVYERDGVTITFGRSDGAGGPEPSRLSLTLNNRDGRFSPRNPMSPLYGKIGRNTPIRVTISGDRAFTGEVASWPSRWNEPGTDAWLPLEAAGILRRIGQGNQPTSGSTKSTYLTTTPISYWPLDDGTTATQGAVAAGTYTNSTISFATTIGGFRDKPGGVKAYWGTGFLADYLSPSLRVDDTVAVGGTGGPSGYIKANAIGSNASPGSLAWEYMFRADTAVSQGANMGALTFYAIVDGTAAGTRDQWILTARRGGNDDLALTLLLDADGVSPSTVSIADTAALPAITDGQLHHIRLQLTQNAGNVDYLVYLDGVSVLSGTRATHTLRGSQAIAFQYDRDGTLLQDLLALGHVIVWETTGNIPTITKTSQAAFGFIGETAGRRVERLCSENGISFTAAGDLDDSQAMGQQYDDPFPTQLTECEDTDFGLVGEDRSALQLYYAPRSALYNLTPTAVIDYERAELSPPLEPLDDDQQTRNDVTASRRDGSTYRYTLTTGSLSTQAPPNGVGQYEAEVTVNPQSDDDLPPIAGWLVGTGTVDAARFPQVTVNRGNPAVSASLNTNIRAVDVGDLIRITGGPKLRAAAGIYDTIDLLVMGGTRFCDGFNDSFTFNCVPYGPYRVAAVDDSDGRADPDGSLTLSSSATSTATSLSVASVGSLASTDVADYPCSVMIAGEEITITAMTGASSPQTATAVRSVNGVVKAQASGAVVNLKYPGQVAL